MAETANDLIDKRCLPCEGEVNILHPDSATELMGALHEKWAMSEDGKYIARNFWFKNFTDTMGFANAVAWIAHTESHHPGMQIGYRNCLITYTTTALGGLSENDFICAAKIDRLLP